MLKLERLKKKLSFAVFIPLTIALTGCLNSRSNSSNQNLVLKGSAAELKETVVLDPAFIHRQEMAERNFFGFTGAQQEHLNNIVKNDEDFPELDDEHLNDSTLISMDAKTGKFGELIWPTVGTFSSAFGMRSLATKVRKVRNAKVKAKVKIVNRTRMHSGIDISAPVGTPIQASADGVVLFAGSKRGYGESVIIGHDNEHETLYAHMVKYVVRNGQFVRREQVIGYVGKSGYVTGANLHYETRVGGVAYNPITYLPPNADGIKKLGMKTPALTTQLAYYQNKSNYALNSNENSKVKRN
ncbi:M23 family metallopeptidase [Pigmentibacter ruber]|uniref:M23 family metallopeptidase n=1 Tax=Pigmentibacter ruber TaxID=2683196 RepID=UPI00131D59F6|nr:M23 family metallopeptidase [Pigmentibacter ruber]BFD31389.1 hypothetical protein GTC16762_10070 [Pigmentibacter ruber]